MKSRRQFRHLLILVAIVLLAYVVLHIYRNLPGSGGEQVDDAPVRQGSDLELSDIAFTETEDGLPVWSLKADSANYSKSGQAVDLEKMEVTFYAPDRSARATLTADRGAVELGTREVTALGDVRVVTGEGARFRTEELRYLHAKRKLMTDDPVEFDFRGAQIQGKGMEYLLDERRLTLLSAVTAEVPMTPGGGAP